MAKLIEDSAWEVDEEAHELHAQGLRHAADEGDYVAAHAAFGEALERLGQLKPSSAVRLQMAHIGRDDGFTYVREAAGSSAPHWVQAEQTLRRSAYQTYGLISDVLLRPRPRTARERALFAEHGATLGLLGRMVIAQQVSDEVLPRAKEGMLPVFDIRHAQRFFGKRAAHHYLRLGSNKYYEVSNAMNGARAELLNGKPLHMLPWLGRAALGISKARGQFETFGTVARSVRHRHEAGQSLVRAMQAGVLATEFGHAIITAARIGWTMRSKQAAVASIKAQP